MKVRTKIAALSVAAASVGTLAAFAAWTSSVDGTGSAASTTSDAGTGDLVAVTPVPADDLYPGAVKSAYVTVKNDNAYPIIVTKVYAGSSRAVGSPSCPADTVRTDELTNSGNAVVQSTGGGTLIDAGETKQYTLVLRMNNDASDNCKSKTFTIGDRTTPASALKADVQSAAGTTGNAWTIGTP